MASETEARADHGAVEMPQPTVAPLVLALGLVLLAAGVATSLALSVVGAALLAIGLGIWVASLLPGRGHMHMALVPADQRPKPILPKLGTVEQMDPQKPGYRLRMPEKIHPISAGVKGGIVGGMVMPAGISIFE